VLPASVRDAIVAHARDTNPDECCGVLVGIDTTVRYTRRARNLADDPRRRFLIDPQTHIDSIRTARAEGLRVVGFYHSHPKSAAEPSPTDVAEATYAEGLYLIVGFPNGQAAEIRGYEWTGDTFTTVAIAHS
jgi:proteasome lid subunit RPN8/RPN11